jgi:hypothetical protein
MKQELKKKKKKKKKKGILGEASSRGLGNLNERCKARTMYERVFRVSKSKHKESNVYKS